MDVFTTWMSGKGLGNHVGDGAFLHEWSILWPVECPTSWASAYQMLKASCNR